MRILFYDIYTFTKLKLITIGVFCRPLNKANFMELIVKGFSHLNIKYDELTLILYKTEIIFQIEK